MPNMMARPSISSILKFNNRWLLVWVVLSLCPAVAGGQNLVFTRTITADRPGAVSIDRLSNIYVTDRRNNLLKFDPNGKLQQTFSPPATGHVASVEAWNMVKILLFYDDRQQITLLDRFLTPITTARLSEFSNGLVKAATLAADDRIWLLNESDFTLTKVDVRYPDAALKTQLNQVLSTSQNDIRLMREYQNNLYILDGISGIYVFDNMGTYKKKLPVRGLTYLGFRGEELYYVKEGQLVFLHLYTQQTRTIALPAGKDYQQALVSDNACYFFTPAGFDIYTLK
jgi:hypothetical protein